MMRHSRKMLPLALGLPQTRDSGTARTMQKPSGQPRLPFKVSQPPVSSGRHVPRKTRAYVTSQWLDEVAAGTEKGIHDTHAWKEAVKRLGLKEARRRLRLGCLTSQLPGPNPSN